MFKFDRTIRENKGRQRSRLFRGIGLAAAVLAVFSLANACGRAHRERDRAEISPEKAEQRLTKVFHRALRRVDATPEQQAKVDAMVKRLTPELMQFQKERRALRDQLARALEGTKVSRAELSEIRTAGLALAERLIDRGIDVIVELSDVLTPEQRKKLVDAWQKRA